MKLPSITTSPETLLETFGVYHLTRLEADKTTKDLLAAFEEAQKRLANRVNAFKAAERSSMTAMAVRDGEDAAFDNTMRAFALAVLAQVGNSRKAPLYLKYFPDGLNAVIGAPLEAELHKAGVILSKLAEEEDQALKAHAGPIQNAVNELSSAMDAHRAALDSQAQAYGMLETEKVNWLDAYKRSYRDLCRIYFKDPKKADTYFKPPTKGKKDNGGGGDVSTPKPPVAKA
jgi:hypothetical protein